MTTLTKSLKNRVVHTVKPLRPRHAIWHFLLTGVGLRLAVYQGLPRLQQLGLAPFEAYSVVFIVPMALLLALALRSAQMEGIPLTWTALTARFRMRRLTWRDVGWAVGGLVVIMGVGSALRPVVAWLLAALPLLQPPAFFPPMLDPMLQNEALPDALAAWAGPAAVGNWGYALWAVLLFFFNNVGEELYWRGFIFPLQEKAHGRSTWLVHGLMWNLCHVLIYPWYIVAGLAPTWVVSYVAQKTQNTTAALLLHALANVFITFLIIPVAVMA